MKVFAVVLVLVGLGIAAGSLAVHCDATGAEGGVLWLIGFLTVVGGFFVAGCALEGKSR